MSTTASPPSTVDADQPERLVRAEQLAAQKIPITRAKVVSIGGGLGSFALVDRLRIGGVADDDIAVVTAHRQPTAALVERCVAAGMTLEDRLRSDSGARVDNLWGFPGYAAEEAWTSRSVKPLARVFGEPVLTDVYTPTVGLMQRGVTREARRIGWSRMTTVAQAEYLFKRAEGGYFVVLRKGERLRAIQCDHVHLALGAPGPALSPEAESFRAGAHPERLRHVYESHEDILEGLERDGGSVIVRGAGMAAAQLLARLARAREVNGADIHVWHVVRQWPTDEGTRPSRRIGLGFTHQSFDFPKAAYGGELREVLLGTSDEEARLRLIEKWGATSTPYRADSADLLRRGRFEGWYEAVVGTVDSFMARGSKVVASVRLQNGKEMALAADHVLDATGLRTEADHHGLVADLLAFSPVGLNRLGGLRVDERFEVIGGASGDGRIFASGATARGGHYGPVDSFSGMQYAALTIADELASSGIGRRLDPWHSFTGWLRWIGGRSL
ncbi:hypothetical protein [Nocardioides ultimimeridianus]